MAIIEFAKAALAEGVTYSDVSLSIVLGETKTIVERYSKLPLLFYMDIDDPHEVYVLGAWKSLDAHLHGFNGSDQQEKLFKVAEGVLKVEWMNYVNIDHAELPLSAPVITVLRTHMTEATNLAKFQGDLAEKLSAITNQEVVFAQSIPKHVEEDNFCFFFVAWESIVEVEDKSKAIMVEVQAHRGVYSFDWKVLKPITFD